ncbi:ADP-ribosylglycohydrolase [Desulfuromonas soudanensis]|uniref:ADP-ribosylglycohydrolase n=1 Tax=Desulfuromonas soudanensis TaxID=1603606 RepID=A0A0M4DI94_9BACT|nr:ADP-ribosylglycohydrolase family protein [Desulfuromonas soudanensis]ALC16887.1 ADP-ribosylglycohydrolase [Desulfuromonas soudanensis]
MLGALAGDIIGSRFEWANHKSKDFDLFTEESRFTDDTVHSVALAESLLDGRPYGELLRTYHRLYPDAGYGGRFDAWARGGDNRPYGSYGNGSAMRVSPVAWFYDDLEAVLEGARRSAVVTHDHPEGIKGAQAVAAGIFLGRSGAGKQGIRTFVEERFGYDLSASLDSIRPGYTFDATCQGSVPEAFIAFFEGEDFEDTLRNAVSLGGDSDTLACIAGSLAEGFYGAVPEAIAGEVWGRLDKRLAAVVRRFLRAL